MTSSIGNQSQADESSGNWNIESKLVFAAFPVFHATRQSILGSRKMKIASWKEHTNCVIALLGEVNFASYVRFTELLTDMEWIQYGKQ